MKLNVLMTLFCSAGWMASLPAFAADSPQMMTISAKSAKPGDTLVITGIALGADKVDEVYLTDQKFDMKVKVLAQKDNSITLRVPPFAKPGRLQLLCLTKGTEPALLEQPLYVVIKDSNDHSVDPAEPKVQVIQMRAEDLPKPGTPITIPIAKKTEPEPEQKKQ